MDKFAADLAKLNGDGELYDKRHKENKMRSLRDLLSARNERGQKQDQNHGPNPGEPPSEIAMMKEQILIRHGESHLIFSGRVGKNRSRDLDDRQTQKQQPRPPRKESAPYENQEYNVRRRIKNGQCERDVNRGSMMNQIHNALTVLGETAWGQLALVALVLFNVGVASAEDDKGRTKALMHSFVLEFAKMSPYLADEKEFNSEKGKAVIGESLESISTRIKKPTALIKDNSGFRISYELLSDHILKTKEAFDRGEMEYARMRVNGIGNLCAGCHMQAPRIAKFSAFEFVVGKNEQINFENAEFLFVIRRYDESLAQFDKLVREFPKGSLVSERLPEVYRRKLAIFARVYRDPISAINNLTEDLKNKSLPLDIRKNIEAWVESLNSWKQEKSNPEEMPTEQLLAFVAGSLTSDAGRNIAPSHPQLLKLLRLSGLLYERLYKEPNGKYTPQILYYLAACERSLSPLYWYSLNEIYLKECIVKFPANSFAKKCYDAYRSGMQERYFGKPLPEGVRQSLEALKKYL
jgi:hypothetical protein